VTTHEYTARSASEAWWGFVAGLILAAMLGLAQWVEADQGPPFSWDDEAVVRTGDGL
jgi:hypothetical protein